MSEEEIIKYAKIFSNAKGDTYKINFVNENKTIDEVEIWKEILNLIDKLQKENLELKEENTILEGNKIGYKLAMQELKEENEELKNGMRINTEIHKRDERIKELEEINVCLHETAKEYFISKDKVKEIIYPAPDNMIPLEVQTSDMYMKLKDLVEE